VLRDTYTIKSGYQVAAQEDSDDFESFAQDINFEDYYQQIREFEQEHNQVKLLQRIKSFFQSSIDPNDPVAFIACGGFW
jgi:hypothetical protein